MPHTHMGNGAGGGGPASPAEPRWWEQAPDAAPAALPEQQQPGEDVTHEMDVAAFDEAFRKMLYRRQAAADLSVHAAGAVLFGIAGTRLLLDGQLRGAALAWASAALATAATWGITYHSRAWCRYREALVAACCALHFNVAAYVASIGLNFIAHHGGSSVRMLVQLAYANTAIWQLSTALLCRIVFRRMVLLQLPLALTALPWGGQLCREACAYPGASDVIQRLYGRLDRLAAYLNPFPQLLPAGRSTQVMCCTISTYSVVICAVVAPLFAAYYQEAAQRRLFLRVWRRHGAQLAAHGSGGSSAGSLSVEPSTPSSTTSSHSHGHSSGGEDAGAATMPLALGRARHARLRRRMQQLNANPTASAEREQEAVAELLQRSPLRPLRWVLAEAAAVSLLAWPLVAVAMDAGTPWLCAHQ